MLKIRLQNLSSREGSVTRNDKKKKNLTLSLSPFLLIEVYISESMCVAKNFF